MTDREHESLMRTTYPGKSLLDAPPQYNANEASAWANGYNAALSKLQPVSEPAEAEKLSEDERFAVYRTIEVRCPGCRWCEKTPRELICRHYDHPGRVGTSGTEWAATCKKLELRK